MLAIALVVLANAALIGRDVYFDLTRAQIFTPSRQAVEVVERLRQDVQVTYFYHAQDQQGKRQKDLLDVLGRRNPRLHVRTIDPDKQPSLAKTYGVRLYNAAVLETGGRRLVVQSTDENEIALGLQRVVRERVVTLCFIAGHTVPLIFSSRASYTQPVAPVETRQVSLSPQPAATTADQSMVQPQPHILAVAVEGTWPDVPPPAWPFRAVVIGDADFASNSFFPYVANSDLVLSMIRWLIREEHSPAVASRIPVPPLMLLTKPQMQQIFLVTEVLLPLSVLVIGAVVWWRRR